MIDNNWLFTDFTYNDKEFSENFKRYQISVFHKILLLAA